MVASGPHALHPTTVVPLASPSARSEDDAAASAPASASAASPDDARPRWRRLLPAPPRHPAPHPRLYVSHAAFACCVALLSATLLLALPMASEAAAGGTAAHRGKNSALFLRHIPQPSHDLEGLYAYGSGGYHHGPGYRTLDDEDKAKPLNGRMALLSRTKLFIRQALESIWPLGGSGNGATASSTSTAAMPGLAAAGAAAGGLGGGGMLLPLQMQHTPPTGFLGRWRASAGLDGSASSSASSTSSSLPPAVGGGGGAGGTRRHHANHYHYRRQHPALRHAHQGVKVGPLLAGRGNLGDAVHPSGGGGSEPGGNVERIGIDVRGGGADASCPVELIAPCAVPSASLKDQGIQREEGLVVPSSFLVGDVVDFVTRMSKLDKYACKTTCRSLERIFVTDCGRLVGYVTSMDLLVHDNAEPLMKIVRPCEVVVREEDEYDDAILAMREKGLTYAPVVDGSNVVTGIITPTDMLNEMEIEATDDVSRFSGSGGGESYFGTPLVQLVTARAWWLISLLMLQSLSSIILTHFSALIERHLVIALFLTMLTGTAGNAGNQSSAMVIRGLATGEINRKNGWKVVMRELKAALLMSVLLAAASFVRVYITPGSNLMSTVAVTVAMFVTVVGACFLGTFAPLMLDRLGLDPCNCASPALATMTDVGGVLILCAISSAMLG